MSNEKREHFKTLKTFCSDYKDLEYEVCSDLSKFSTFKLKASGELIKVKSQEGLERLLTFSKSQNIAYRIIGLGANQMLEDTTNFYYLKLVWSEQNKVALDLNLKATLFEFPATIPLSKLTSLALKHGLKGWEVFTGIPATLGGAIVMNAGTNLGEISSLLASVTILNLAGEIQEIEVSEEMFSYRKNNFLKIGEVIVAAKLKNLGQDNSVPEKIEQYLELRTNSQPLWDKTCGCTFKNYSLGSDILPAGKYIDLIGLKGFQYGRMKVSEKHANFFVNQDGANKKEALEFIEIVQDMLNRSYGVTFEKEIKTD